MCYWWRSQYHDIVINVYHFICNLDGMWILIKDKSAIIIIIIIIITNKKKLHLAATGFL